MPAGSDVMILDGGLGRQLARMGAPFRLPEWSALALIEAPEFVSQAHAAFIASGADVITTNSYALVPNRIGEARFEKSGQRLAALAGRLARSAADAAHRPVQVAASLPPLFESYRPQSFEAARAPQILHALVEGLGPHADLWLIETQSSTAESTAAIEAIRHTGLPIWVSYTLRDEAGRVGPAELRSGESVEQAVSTDIWRGAQAVLFNCSQPEVMDAAVLAAIGVVRGLRSSVRIGVYANAFMPEPRSQQPYAGISTLREDLDPQRYLDWATRWTRSGATIVGGCCGVGPEHIAALHAYFR
jgi:S-methylmethionine-dependent homocysteine/selenocysteine methylase